MFWNSVCSVTRGEVYVGRPVLLVKMSTGSGCVGNTVCRSFCLKIPLDNTVIYMKNSLSLIIFNLNFHLILSENLNFSSF